MTKRTAVTTSSSFDFSVRRWVRKRKWVPGEWHQKHAAVKGVGFVPTGEWNQSPGHYVLERTGALGEEIARFRHERDALYFARKRGSAYDQPELVVFHNNRVIGTDLGKGRGIPVIDGDATEVSPVAELPSPTPPVPGWCEPMAANAGDE